MDLLLLAALAGLAYLAMKGAGSTGTQSAEKLVLAPGLSARKQTMTATAPVSKLPEDPAPDLSKFSPLFWKPAAQGGDQSGPGRVGDMHIAIMDMDPELPGGLTEAGINFDAYMARMTAVRPSGIQITALSVDKAAGGEDKATYRYPDGRVRSRLRKRGEEWPSEWAGKIMWINWHDFPGTSLESMGTLAEAISGRQLPYMVCRARKDRTPARKQVEIIRIAKMDKRYRDQGERYWLPAVAMVGEYVGQVAGGAMSGLSKSLVTFTTNLMTQTIRYAASGNLDSWRDGVRVLRRSISLSQAESIAVAIDTRLPSHASAAVVASLKAVKNASAYTHLIASYAGTAAAAIWERNRRAEIGGSPSKIANVTVYV